MNPRDGLSAALTGRAWSEPTVDEPGESWQDAAECKGLEASLFFPERGDMTTLRAAQAVCAACSVAAECLEYALDNAEQYGVFGGVSERQRRRMRRERAGRVTRPRQSPNRVVVAVMWAEGHSRQEIVEATGLAYNTVAGFIRELVREEAS